MKTSELTGAALDWAVAKCEGGWILDMASFTPHHSLGRMNFATNWSQGGPIIERERLLVQPEIGKAGAGNAWSAIAMDGFECFGPTPLIAAMRCYVASKLGDEVEIPEELS